MSRLYPAGPFSTFLGLEILDTGATETFFGAALATFATASFLGAGDDLTAPGELISANGAVMMRPRAAAAPPRRP